MFEHIKKRIINGLIEEIKCLDAIGLELVGHNYISVTENQKLIHHGINKDYKPSGYTVDTFSNDSTIVGEYSTEKGYFEYQGKSESPVYEKIDKDLTHAISHKKPHGPDKVYLISNKEEPPSFRSKFNITKNAILYGEKLIIIDARELAKAIYEQSIANPSAADFYKQFLPTFSQDLDNYEYFGKLPAICECHVSEQEILNAIASHYKNGNYICVLHGVSGSGKTQAAIDYIHKNADTYLNYIWISGEDWKENTSLSSVQRTRGGVPVNVAGLFNSTKSILVIDNFERDIESKYFEELQTGLKKGGVVLVTSQLSVPQSPLYVSIPQFSKINSIVILGEDTSSVSELCNDFISKCSFSPLILSMTRKLAASQDLEKEEIYQEVLNDPELIDDTQGTSIIKRILNRLEPRALDALKKIANSGQNSHDTNFLRYFIGVICCNTLQKLSILAPTNTLGVLRIHDLVSIAVQGETGSQTIVAAIEEFVSKKKGEMTPSVLRQIHLCLNQMYEEHLRRGQRVIDWLHYALLQCEDDKKLDLHEGLHNLSLTPNLSLASVMCIIDAKEIHSYTIVEPEVRKRYYKECVELYEKAIEETQSEDVKAELLHHKGKALRRCGKSKEALATFSALLKLKPEWHATHGQIAHLGIQRDIDKELRNIGEESIRILLKDMLCDSSSVPLRVSLAALAKLRSYRAVKNDILKQPDNVKKLADIIAMSALEGLDQFYEAYVSFTSIFGYQYSSLCVNIAEAIPEMTAIPPNRIERRQWVSACEALTNTSIAAGRQNKPDLSHRLIEASISFAEEISRDEILSSYDARAVAKAYNVGKDPQKAIDAIKKVAEDEIDHWLLYEQAKTYLETGAHKEALDSAGKCFQMAQVDHNATSRISIYHDLLSKCYEAMGDHDNATVQAKYAVDKCANKNYKAELQDRLSALENC